MAWYDEAVFYHIYPLGLCGCAHENDGQPTPDAFAKLEAWAAHAAKLGCTAIYIGPLFESGSHGYDTIDYRRVQPCGPRFLCLPGPEVEPRERPL